MTGVVPAFTIAPTPQVSPDGKLIAYCHVEEPSADAAEGASARNPDIYVMNADGSGVARLTDSAASDVYPTWSPDGSQIAFLTDRTGQWEIWVMNADGSDQHSLFDAAVQTQLATELGLQYNGVDERMLSWTQ